MIFGDKGKIAQLIVRAISDSSPDLSEEPKKEDKEEEKSDDNYGMETSMKKLMQAFKDEDVKAACEAMCEFMEMSSGYKYYKDPSE